MYPGNADKIITWMDKDERHISDSRDGRSFSDVVLVSAIKYLTEWNNEKISEK